MLKLASKNVSKITRQRFLPRVLWKQPARSANSQSVQVLNYQCTNKETAAAVERARSIKNSKMGNFKPARITYYIPS